MRKRYSFAARERALVTTVALACVGVGTLPAVAHAEVCPNAASRSGASAGLPDCRVYEMVSPVNNEDGDVYVPATGPHGDAIFSARPFRASADGDAVAYVGDPSSEGNGAIGEGVGNSYLAMRAPTGGWTSHDIQPPGLTYARYEAFSSDLSLGILNSSETLPGTGVPEELAGYDVLYSRTDSNGAYRPLFTTKPPNRLPGTNGALGQFGTAYSGSGGASPLLYAGANSGTSTVPAFSHTLFEANDALTASAVDPGDEANNLYDSVNGHLTLINALPSGAPEPNENATFGAPREGSYFDPSDFSHDISADGSRIFWSSLNSGGQLEDLYVRENGTETVLISEGGRFWTANGEGTEAFFTKGDLYEWHEVDGAATTADLTPGVEVQGVLGASENGEYVYYVDASDDLDLWHNGVTTFIATLSPGDNNNKVIEEGVAQSGDWKPGLGQRTAEVTLDGRAVVFMSSQSLTGYSNEGLEEVYVYDADASRLFCASCDPSGAPPSIAGASHTNGYLGNAAFLPLSFSYDESMNTYQPRWINEEGSRVFFDSAEPLVAQDSNGVQDVYEWERDGTGSCQTAEGCVYLLSGGTSTDISALVDASANGDDVFLVTRAPLVPQDRNEDDELYDARVYGVQPLVLPACTETGCQGVPSAPPPFATPPSVTFRGVGNFEPPPLAAAVKPKPKSKPAKCKKDFVKKKGKCEKNKKAKKVTKGSPVKGGKRHV